MGEIALRRIKHLKLVLKHFYFSLPESNIWKDHLFWSEIYFTFIAALFTIAKTWKKPKCPSTDEWIKKIWYIYIMEYYSAIKKEWNNAICHNMDGPRDYHTKWSRTKTNIWYHLYVESKKMMQMNLLTKQKLSQT